MRSRIEDVAAAAGVSMKTVSRVLNNEPNVRDEMRQRVMAVVEKLQYRPNLSARSLAGQRSYVIALVYNNPSRNYLMEIQNGMLEACRDNHYNLVLAPVGASRQRKVDDLKVVFEHFAPDGVVLIPPLTDDPVVLEFLEANHVAFACIAPKHPDGRIGVMMDETAAVRELMAGLVAQGVGLWIGIQAFINLGVNLGLLPTKGLTLPLMSFGGSAILMTCVALAIVLRIDFENRRLMRGSVL